jgi:hypothetical protein
LELVDREEGGGEGKWKGEENVESAKVGEARKVRNCGSTEGKRGNCGKRGKCAT